MEIVIKITEHEWEYLNKLVANGDILGHYERLLVNGAPLPKGHGKLIDADALQKTYCDDNCGNRKCVDAMDRCVFIGAVLEAPTIIEADKE